MLDRFDDYAIHQTPEPISRPASSDRNVYDRYWFNGYDRDGDFYFAVAMGLYPHLGVLDCAFSLVKDGTQHCFFASRRAPTERSETRVGPFHLQIQEPMREIRLTIERNDTGVEADLRFRARTAAVQEGRQTSHTGEQLMMDATRFAQWGTWEGSVGYAGNRLDVDPSRVLGTKDRSWGIRPVGEPDRRGAPPTAPPQIFFLWAPLHFDDVCTHFCRFEDSTGHAWSEGGAVTPTYAKPSEIPGTEDPATVHLPVLSHDVRYFQGTRRASHAKISIGDSVGRTETIELDPLLCFRMKGIGYGHPKWRHGAWHGELEIGSDSWKTDELDELAPENVHIQQVMRARWGDREGVGVLEQIAIGPHVPSGFRQVLDGARG